MGNRFGHYATVEAAEAILADEGFERKESNLGVYFTKPSTDGFGFPMTAMVEITENFVAAEYTATGQREVYFEHHFIGA